MAKIKNKPAKGTANRYDGRFDYTLPAPWEVPSFEATSGEISADTASLSTLADGTPFLPLTITNYGSPGEGRNDDDDGFFYDVLPWEIEEGSNLGFEQDVYVFREPARDASEFGTSSEEVQVRLKPNSLIKEAIILIADHKSPTVQFGNDLTEQLIDLEGSGAIAASDGNDILMGLEGSDVLIGGAGNDLIYGGSDGDMLSGSAGDDEIYGEDAGDTLNGGAGGDCLYGGSGADSLYGGAADDILYGGSGRDTLDGETGNNTLYGGTGDDIYIVDDLSDRLIEQVNEGKDVVQSSINYTLGANLEDLELIGESAIVSVGNKLDNRITSDDFSSSANKIIDARGGNDYVFVRSGNDFINGGDGNDALYGGQGDDRLEGGNGDDKLEGGGGGFDDGTNTLDGGNGNDTLNGGDGIDFLIGGDGNDNIYGGNGFFDNDNLQGGNGNDLLKAGFGNDQLTGGAGADIFVAFRSTNQFSPGRVDTITDFRFAEGDKIRVYASELGISVGDYSSFFYSSGTGALYSGFDQLLSLQPGTDFVIQRDIEIVASRPFAPFEPFQPTEEDNGLPPAGKSIAGTTGSDRLSGDENNDSLSGLAGADTLSGLEGDDRLNGGDDADLLSGGSGSDRLQGELGNDNLFGETGDDAIEGNGGSDTLTGGTGDDTLTGGTGLDRFNFYSPAGIDRITDFNLVEDKIGLYVGIRNVETPFRAARFTANAAIAPDQFRIGTAAATSSDRIIYDRSTGALFFDVDGTDATAQVQIATLSPGLNLSNTNIHAFDDTNLTAKPILTTGTKRKDKITGTTDDERLLGFAGNDALNGGEGNDRLIGGKGSDRLIGGVDRDIFVLEKRGGRDAIADFKDRQDHIGLATGLKFNQLGITQQGSNTIISYGDEQLAMLLNIRKNRITKADFVSAKSL
jgi:Ca2+-binding RTX toxin-like protein